MIPEHVKMLRNLWHNKLEQFVRPVLDEYEIEEIENKIHFANECSLPSN
jgi:hypothetical protein